MSGDYEALPGTDIGIAGLGSLRAAFFETWRRHWYFTGLILLYLAALFICGWVFGTSDGIELTLYFDSLTGSVNLFFVVALFSVYTLHVMVFVRPDHLTQYLWRDVRNKYLTAERFWLALPVLVLMPFFLSAFTSFKMMVPGINPYSWDPSFAEWDRLLHGGIHPWQWLQPLLGHPSITVAIDYAYMMWFGALHLTLFWQTFSLRDPHLRMQFLISFILSWILVGTAAAILFSSAGPCYYGRITGLPDPFLPLMDYLRSVGGVSPIKAVESQEMLWGIYQSGESRSFSGMSAMPSMHLAVSTLLALVGWRTHRWLGISLTVFALAILIGSVHLGWHYAIDGYLAILMTLAIWYGVGWCLRRSANAPQGRPEAGPLPLPMT